MKTKSLFEWRECSAIIFFLCSRPFRIALQLNGKLRVTDIQEVKKDKKQEGGKFCSFGIAYFFDMQALSTAELP